MPYRNIIQAFFIFDEPRARDSQQAPCGRSVGNANLIVDRINYAIQLVKLSFPEKPTAIVFDAPEVKDALIIPRLADWVGMDCYGDFYRCGAAGISIPAYYDIIKSKLLPHQRLILFPQSFRYEKPGHEWYTSDDKIVADLERYYNLLLLDRSYVGFFPYLWQSFSDPVGLFTGAQNIPKVRAKLKEIGWRLSRNYAAFHSTVYQPKIYRELNPDLKSFTDSQLEWHWESYGISEGRRASYEFSSREYRQANPGITTLFPGYLGAIIHYYLNLPAL